MAQIMNKGLRTTIKTLMMTKMLDELGVKAPPIPETPKFEKPPMPDLSAMMSSLPSPTDITNAYKNLYTDDYVKKMEETRQNLEKENEKYKTLYGKLKDAEDSLLYSNTNDESEQARIESEYDATISYVNGVLASDYEENEGGKDTSSCRDKLNEGYRKKLETIKKGLTEYKGTKYKIAQTVEDKKNVEKGSEDAAAVRKALRDEMKKEFLKNAIVKQYTQYIERQEEIIIRTAKQAKQTYEDLRYLFTECPKNIKKYYTDADAPGSQRVERLCDDIDELWSNAMDTTKELGVDLSAMTSKIAMPSDVVVGTAVGVPNPAYKITVFMENFKKVITDITKLSNYIKQMIKIAKEMGFDLKSIPAFAKLIEMLELLQGDMDKQFRQSVKKLRKRTKWVLEIDEMIDDDDKDEDDKTSDNDADDEPEYKTRKAGYKYAVLDVDYENYDIKLLGYRCYCTKNRNAASGKRAWHANVGKSRQSDPSFIYKHGGPMIDTNGKHYYYMPADDPMLYGSGGDAFSDETPSRDGINLTTDNDGVMLKLGDGRVVKIDYQAEVGDVIRLNDGTIIKVDES